MKEKSDKRDRSVDEKTFGVNFVQFLFEQVEVKACRILMAANFSH